MKRGLLSIGTFFFFGLAQSQSVFINEIHYDNVSTDSNEGVEIAGPAGTDLSTYSLVFYNGVGSLQYLTLPLSGTILDQSGCGYGVIWFAQAVIQNGSPDGVALVQGISNVVQFLSYEGTITAADGPANGLTSTDIGVSEDGTNAVGTSLQLTGNGTQYSDFTWAPASLGTNGQINTSQNFCASPTPTVAFSTANQSVSENSGTVTVTLSLNIASAANESVDISISDNTATYGSDYTTTPSGPSTFSVTIPSGSTSATFDVVIINDGTSEASEDFTLAITNTSAGLQTGGISAHLFTILDDDMQTTPISMVQTTTSGDQSDMLGSVVTIGGRVSAIKANAGFWIQDAPAAWSGIYVYDFGNNIVALGDSVILTGTVTEFAPGTSAEKTTQITTLTNFSNQGSFNVYAPLTIGTLEANNEMYESVLIKVAASNCTTIPDGFGEWSVNDGSGNVKVDDFLYTALPIPAVGNLYNVTGVISHSFAAYKILPRDAADVELLSGASINEVKDSRISIYPNPSSGMFNVVNANGETIRVYNSLGQLVLTTKNTKISLKSGVYILKIGQFTHRVVVQ